MTREELKKIGLDDEKTEQVMQLYGKSVTADKDKIQKFEETEAQYKTQIEGLKAQITQRDTDIAELKKTAGNTQELTSKLTELQTKYDTDTKALNDKLSEQAVGFAAEKFFDGYRFSSKAARRAAMQDFKASENVKFSDGQFIGGKEFMEKYKADDPESFLPEEGGEGGNDGNNGAGGNDGNGGQGGNAGEGGYPRFSPNDGGQNGNAGNRGESGFSLNGFNLVRPIPGNK